MKNKGKFFLWLGLGVASLLFLGLLIPSASREKNKGSLNWIAPDFTPDGFLPRGTNGIYLLYPIQNQEVEKIGREYHTRLSDGSIYLGNDFFAPRGAMVHAMAGGRIVSTGTDPKLGNIVTIVSTLNGMEFIIIYAHLDRIYVQQGQTIETGVGIGTVGSTGKTDPISPTGAYLSIFWEATPNIYANIKPYVFSLKQRVQKLLAA